MNSKDLFFLPNPRKSRWRGVNPTRVYRFLTPETFFRESYPRLDACLGGDVDTSFFLGIPTRRPFSKLYADMDFFVENLSRQARIPQELLIFLCQ
jgi:hypothetical protein